MGETVNIADAQTQLSKRVARAEAGESLPLANPCAIERADLPLHHRDPLDRMLVAQCITDDLVLITDDQRLSDDAMTTLE